MDLRFLLGFFDAVTAVLGLFLVYGVLGAIDTATNSQLPVLIVIAVSGMALSFSGLHGLTTRR